LVSSDQVGGVVGVSLAPLAHSRRQSGLATSPATTAPAPDPTIAQFAVLFADARDCSKLIAWSLVHDVILPDHGTAYSIGKLYRIDGRRPQQLRKLSDGLPIAAPKQAFRRSQARSSNASSR
jgi:hypothetical protein